MVDVEDDNDDLWDFTTPGGAISIPQSDSGKHKLPSRPRRIHLRNAIGLVCQRPEVNKAKILHLSESSEVYDKAGLHSRGHFVLTADSEDRDDEDDLKALPASKRRKLQKKLIVIPDLVCHTCLPAWGHDPY